MVFLLAPIKQTEISSVISARMKPILQTSLQRASVACVHLDIPATVCSVMNAHASRHAPDSVQWVAKAR